jgi:hypothetical protein
MRRSDITFRASSTARAASASCGTTGDTNPTFSLKVRDDDEAYLCSIAERAGFGLVNRIHRRAQPGRHNNPVIAWNVRKQADVVRLVAFLDRFPLQSKKARDYEVWRRAVKAWLAMPRRNVYRPRDWSELLALKRELEAVRRYSGPDGQARPAA